MASPWDSQRILAPFSSYLLIYQPALLHENTSVATIRLIDRSIHSSPQTLYGVVKSIGKK